MTTPLHHNASHTQNDSDTDPQQPQHNDRYINNDTCSFNVRRAPRPGTMFHVAG